MKLSDAENYKFAKVPGMPIESTKGYLESAGDGTKTYRIMCVIPSPPHYGGEPQAIIYHVDVQDGAIVGFSKE
jgi:hypothetical protein